MEHEFSQPEAWGMWDLLGSGIELVSTAMQGGYLATRPPGKSREKILMDFCVCVLICCSHTFLTCPKVYFKENLHFFIGGMQKRKQSYLFFLTKIDIWQALSEVDGP